MAKPCPTSSWLADKRCRVCEAIALAMEIASTKPIKPITIAVIIKELSVLKSKLTFGSVKDGKPFGISPIILPPKPL